MHRRRSAGLFYLAEKDQCRGWRLWWSYPRRPSDLPVRLFSMGHLLQQKRSLAAPVLTKLLLLTVILFSGGILSILSLAISQSY